MNDGKKRYEKRIETVEDVVDMCVHHWKKAGCPSGRKRIDAWVTLLQRAGHFTDELCEEYHRKKHVVDEH